MTTDEALKMLEKANKIDTLGETNPGRIVDLYNQLLEKKKEKYFMNNISDMNQYYIKLLVDTINQKQSGVVNPIYKSNTILVA